MIGSRTIETGDADVVRDRRRRVDDPRAVGAAQAVAGLPGRQRRRGVDDAGLAAGQRADAGGVDGLAGRGQRAARRPVAISRERQDAFAARSHDLADAAWKAGFYDDLVVPVAGADLTRDEGIRPGRSVERLAGAQAVVPSATARSPPATPRR